MWTVISRLCNSKSSCTITVKLSIIYDKKFSRTGLHFTQLVSSLLYRTLQRENLGASHIKFTTVVQSFKHNKLEQNLIIILFSYQSS